MTLVKELAKMNDNLEKQYEFEKKLSTYINSPKVKSIIQQSISNDIYIKEPINDTKSNKIIEFHVTDSSQFSGLDSYEISIFEDKTIHVEHNSYKSSPEICNIQLKPTKNKLTNPTNNFEVVVLHMDEEKLSYDDVYTYIKNAVGIEDESES
jgi:hypothetical protein